MAEEAVLNTLENVDSESKVEEEAPNTSEKNADATPGAEEETLKSSESRSSRSSSVSRSSSKYEMSSVLQMTVLSLHKASLSSERRVRAHAVESLLLLADSDSRLVLDAFLVTFENLGKEHVANFSEYASKERVRSLAALDKIVARFVAQNTKEEGSENDQKKTDKEVDKGALKTCIGRVISLATEEMARYPEVVPDIQKPCSQVLTQFGQMYMERVMDALLLKFQPNSMPHYYVVHTLSNLAVANSSSIVPFVKVVLGTLVAHVKAVKKDNMKYAFAGAFGRLSEAIEEYLSSNASSTDRSVSAAHFLPELDNGHDHLFSSWLTSSRDLKVKHAVLDALGSMSNLLSEDRLRSTTSHMLVVLLATYKRTPEPFFVTHCLSKLIRAVVRVEPSILDSSVETLLAALFLQICEEQQQPQSSARPLSKKNTNEVLRCYDSLIASHKDKLLTGLILRLSNVDENVRLASLTILKHLMNTSMSSIEDRLEDINECLHMRIKGEVGSLRVKKMLAQIVAQIGRLGFVDNVVIGKDYIEFIVRLCALSDDEEANDNNEENDNVATASSVRRMSDQILLLWAKSVPQMEPLLWPNLLQYLVLTDYHKATSSVVRALALLAEKKSNDQEFIIDYNDQSDAIPGPHSIFSRLLVIASWPQSNDNNVAHSALSFLLHCAPNISKHVQSLWHQRIPLLLHYLQSEQTPEVQQWQEWLMALLEDTVVEIDLEEWNHSLLREMSLQLHFPFLSQSGKGFLMTTMGVVLKLCTNRNFISEQLNLVLNSVSNSSQEQQACALSFGKCSKKHLGLVIECLEAEILRLGRLEQQKKGFFSSLLPRDKQSDEHKVQEKKVTVIQCVGEVALCAPINELEATLDNLTLKFIMPSLRSNRIVLRMAAMTAVMKLATAIEPDKLGGYEIELVHHDDIVEEGINALKNGSNDDKEYNDNLRLNALLAMAKIVVTKPWLNSKTRLALLKASFDALFNRIKEDGKEQTKTEDSNDGLALSKSKPSSSLSSNDIKIMASALDTLVSTLLRQSLMLSTLDEMFTLIEPWLKKRDCSVTREISIRLLHTILDTYAANIEFKVGQPTNFSPGPYILGAVIPRCFDVQDVQEWALKCQLVILKILALYDGRVDDDESNEVDEEEEKSVKKKRNDVRRASELRRLSPLSLSSSSVEALSRTSTPLASLLIQRVLPHQLVPLVHSLIDSLSDTQLNCARGTALVLEELIGQRGQEVYNHIGEIVQRLHSQLKLVTDELTTEHTLISLHRLAKLDAFPVVSTLIAMSNGDKGDVFPLDKCLSNVWQTLGKNQVGIKVVNHLVNIVDGNRDSNKDDNNKDKENMVNRSLLASLAALSIAFETRVDEFVNDDASNDIDFAHVFVVLVSALRNLVHANNFHHDYKKNGKHDKSNENDKKDNGHVTSKGEAVVKEGPVAKLKKTSLSSLIHKDKQSHINNTNKEEKDENKKNILEKEESKETDAKTQKSGFTSPFDLAKETLVNFLKSQGCVPLDKIASTISSQEFSKNKDDDVINFETMELFGSNCLAPLLIAILLDFPQLHKDLLSKFEKLLNTDKVTATIFFAQLLLVLKNEEQLRPVGRELHGHAQQAARLLMSVVQEQTGKGEDDNEDYNEAFKNPSSKPSVRTILLLLSLSGLASFETLSLSIREDIEDDMGSRSLLQSILTTFLALVGEDFRSGLNYHTLKGLKYLIQASVEGQVDAETQRRLLIEVATKIRVFFDSATQRESREAIETFGKLALVVESHKDVEVLRQVFVEHVHNVLVSLLLHANDERKGVRVASINTLMAIAPVILEDNNEVLEALKQLLLDTRNQSENNVEKSKNVEQLDEEDNSNFITLLRAFAQSKELSEMLGLYVDQSLNFFLSSCCSRLRCNSALALSGFVCDGGCRIVDLDRVCNAFNALLDDSESDVQAAAALAVGKVVVALRQELQEDEQH